MTSPYAMEESIDALERKRPDRLSVVPELIAIGRIRSVADASEKLIARCSRYISYKDAPVLAAVIRSRSRILLTLDREHFFAPSVKRTPGAPSIMTPDDFIHAFLDV